MKISDKDFHPHILKRMSERGITKLEIKKTLNDGLAISDVKAGTLGKKYLFNFNNVWNNKFYKFKEVKVFYKLINKRIILLTAISRFGNEFKI